MQYDRNCGPNGEEFPSKLQWKEVIYSWENIVWVLVEFKGVFVGIDIEKDNFEIMDDVSKLRAQFICATTLEMTSITNYL
jgi:hypothetical protein